jgi:hypothetical protein
MAPEHYFSTSPGSDLVLRTISVRLAGRDLEVTTANGIFSPERIDTGTQVRIAGEGEPGPRGGPRGDLYCIVVVKSHPLFQRDGDDLHLEIPVGFANLVLGTKIQVPTLSGTETISLPARTPSHTVLRVLDGARPDQRPPDCGGPGKIVPLIADSSRLTFLGDGCADGVIADDRALSVYLAAEAMIAEIARVLRPAGRVIACVDSLVLGMAVLADQHHWAHLVDLPHAEVVLVPWPDGRITRCYGSDQARELFTGAGLRVNWIRSRTVFSESVVTHWLRRDPGGLHKLVRAELAARSDESLGAQLVISASKPRWPRDRD